MSLERKVDLHNHKRGCQSFYADKWSWEEVKKNNSISQKGICCLKKLIKYIKFLG